MNNPSLPVLPVLSVLPVLAIPLLLIAGCAAPAPKETAKAQEPGQTTAKDTQLEQARTYFKAGDLDRALLVTDRILKDQPGHKDARILAADANMALTRSVRQYADRFAQDAISNMQRAVEHHPGDGDLHVKLAQIYYDVYSYQYLQPNWELGRESALAARNCYRNANAGTEKIAAATLWAARFDLRLFIDVRRPEIAAGETGLGKDSAAKATTVLTRLAEAKQMGTEETRGQAYVISSLVYQWMSQHLMAIQELERGMLVAPNHQALHEAYIDAHLKAARLEVAVAAYRRMMLENGRQPGLLHGYAEAKVRVADNLRKQRQFADATKAYEEALAAFKELEQARDISWQEYYREYRAIVQLTLASMNLEAGELEQARRHAFQAHDATPKVLQTDDNGFGKLADRDGTSFYFSILSNIGLAISRPRTATALRQALAYWEELIARHSDVKYGWMYNNAALNARDLGTQVDAAGRNETGEARERASREAMALWEKSYALYTVAAELSPDDPRIANDCGLLLVYHLKRDYDRAETLFQQAIRIGQGKLDEMPADTELAVRQDMEEAVGDAYQNTAVMLVNQGKPFAAYEEFCKKAVKYYPYQQRQAARMLSAGAKDGTVTGAAASKPAPDRRATGFQQVMVEAKKKADAKDFDGALLVLDKVAKDMQGYAPYHYTVGLYSLLYANQVRLRDAAQGGTGGIALPNSSGRMVDGLYADARMQLQKSVQLDGEPCEPRLYLAEANYESGELVNAAKICDSLLSHIASRGGTDKKLHGRALQLRAQSGTRIYLRSRQENRNDTDQLNAARSSFRALEQMGELQLPMLGEWAALESGAGQDEAAVQIYVRALQKQPDDQQLLGGLTSQAASASRSDLAVAALEKRTDGVGIWYLGKARYGRGRELLAKGEGRDGLAALEKAIADFQRSMQADQDFKYSCNAMMALCRAEMAYHFASTGDFDRAGNLFLAAAGDRPDRVAAPLDASPGRSVRTGLFLVVDHHYKAKDLAAAEQVLRKAGKVLPNDPGIANDHGLMARDHGVELEAAGKQAAAREMFEASFASYRRAAQLEPHNLRLVNDLALLQIYHLKRDLEAARKNLQHAIKTGKERLAEEPPSDDKALTDLKETIGDCHQNLGYCQMVHDKDYKEARRNFEESLKWYPFKKRGSVQHLKELDKLEGAGK